MTDGHAQPPQSPARPGFEILQAHIGVAALILSALLTFAGVKLTSLLPDKLYFSYSKVVDNAATSPFLISIPPYISPDQLCDVLKSHSEIKQLQCNQNSSQDNAPTSEAYDDEVKIANHAVFEAAQRDGFFYSIVGYLIRLLAPLLAGFVIGRIYGLEDLIAAPFGAALAAFILCWPVIVLWDRVVSTDFINHYSEFITLYVLNMIAFFYVARIGCILGAQMKVHGPVIRLNLSKIIEGVIIAVASGVAEKVVENIILKS